MTNTDRNDDIYTLIDEITDYLAGLTKEAVSYTHLDVYKRQVQWWKEAI